MIDHHIIDVVLDVHEENNAYISRLMSRELTVTKIEEGITTTGGDLCEYFDKIIDNIIILHKYCI